MQLLTLAGSLFLVIYSAVAQGAETVGPCELARQQAGQPMPGRFIPQCTEYGYFKPAQCHGSTGKCWCVVPDTGVEVKGSSTLHTGEPQCTMCNIKRSEALRPLGWVGQYVPTCDQDGLFDASQFHGSTGYSWCVNPYTGEEIPNSRVGPGQQRKITCGAVAHLAGLKMHAALVEQGPCYAKIVDARGRVNTPGFYTPKCTVNGFYKTEQYHASTGYTWCVNPATGVEVQGTRRAPAQPRANCGACFKDIEAKLSRKPLMGADLPQCNNENGEYVPVQHFEGYSYCVNSQTGAVEGKKNPPGDNTPLPCLNH